LYQASGRRPYDSINFITSHDGFTLNDLHSYLDKHNEANQEGNRDGDNNNFSNNYGVEGPTRQKHINAIRLRQIKNNLATLLLSQGVPMLLFGDECRRTQNGNNNAYCQDNKISWFDWDLVEENAELVRFFRELISFRRRQPTVKRRNFLSGKPAHTGALPDVSWFSSSGAPVDWKTKERALTCLLGPPGLAEDAEQLGRPLLLLFNAGAQPVDVVIPDAARNMPWRTFLDTAAPTPHDIFTQADGPPIPPAGRMTLVDRSMRCFVAARQR
jgi:glycogen operon protein